MYIYIDLQQSENNQLNSKANCRTKKNALQANFDKVLVDLDALYGRLVNAPGAPSHKKKEIMYNIPRHYLDLTKLKTGGGKKRSKTTSQRKKSKKSHQRKNKYY